MALDPARAALVTQDYRYAKNEDTSIKARLGSGSPELLILTNLDATGGTALASSWFTLCSAYANTYDVQVEGVFYLEDFTTSPNRYTLSFSRHPDAGTNTYTVIGAKIDYYANRTTLTVRG